MATHLGGGTACGDQPEPIINELNILSNYKDKISGIIIDDFRTFIWKGSFPSKSSVLLAIETQFPDWDVKIHLDQVVIKKKMNSIPT